MRRRSSSAGNDAPASIEGLDDRDAGSHLVEVKEVARAPVDEDLLWGRALERPHPRRVGQGSASYALDVGGWALGRRSPVVAVEIAHGGGALREVPVAHDRPDVAAAHPHAPRAPAGFRAKINTLMLPPAFELDVRAVLADGARAPIASVSGRRGRLPGARPAPGKPLPLLVTSNDARSAAVLAAALRLHPASASPRPSGPDPRVAHYWVSVMLALSDPGSYLQQIAGDQQIHERFWWLGASLSGDDLVDRELEDWLGSDGARALAGFCRTRIEALYPAGKDEPGGSAPFFAEPFTPDAVPGLVRELYPEAREVFLLREDADGASALLGARKQRSEGALLAQAEELERHPQKALERLLRALELDANDALIERMASTLEEALAERPGG